MKHLLPACDEAAARKDFGKFEYKPFVPRVLLAKGRFIVTRVGAMLPSLRWCLRTNYRGHPTRFLHIIAGSVWSVFRRGVGRFEGGNKPHALIHSAWTGGYYHWLTESMPRALTLKKTLGDCIPILPTESYFGYRGGLTALGFAEVAFFPAGQNTVLVDPVVTTCPPKFGTTDPALLQQVRDAVLTHHGLGASVPHEVVYVSRRKSRGRTVVNESGVVDALEQFGVRSVCFEDMSFEEQVALMAKTRCLISIKGAGLTNMMFMPAGGVAIELLPKRNGIFDYGQARMSFRHDPCYIRLAAATGHRYGYLLCQHDVKWWQATQMSNITVDVGRLVAMVQSAGLKQ